MRSISLIAAVAIAGLAQAGDKIPWMTDLGKAKQVAKKSKRVLLVDFYADW